VALWGILHSETLVTSVTFSIEFPHLSPHSPAIVGRFQENNLQFHMGQGGLFILAVQDREDASMTDMWP